VLGLPGDGINGVFEALRKEKERIRFIHVRREEATAFIACAYAKFVRKLGVCICNLGTRRDPSPEGSLGRQDGPCACARDYWYAT
jgi:glyoxylate carboligase